MCNLGFPFYKIWNLVVSFRVNRYGTKSKIYNILHYSYLIHYNGDFLNFVGLFTMKTAVERSKR